MAMHSLLCMLVIMFVNAELIKGLTVELIHRNSPQSPLYNASATPEDLSIDAVSRSLARYRNYYNQNKIQSTVIPNGGNYLMKLAVGTPPAEQFAVLDTGSDLIWIQCQPCTNCYNQDAPFFDPSQSSTFSNNVPCTSEACRALPRSGCGQSNDRCLYDYRYGDKSYTDGELATDTFTFDGQTQTEEFPGTIFGCGHMNAGTFSHGSGLVGLGQGALSLNSQIADKIHKKFAYCLVPVRSGLNSKLKFGEDADIASAANAVSTPMLTQQDSFYHLNLEAVTIGGNTIQNQMSGGGGGDIIIDSGTTLNYLNPGLYSDLEAAVSEMVGLNSMQHPSGAYNLCYETESLTKVPEIQMTFHFTGADVILNSINIFKLGGYGLSCLSMAPSEENGPNIYGNRAQINFQVEYDLGSNKISFAPADCTQF